MVNHGVLEESYHRAQRAIADLKFAIHAFLSVAPEQGRTNAVIGRSLGIYHGHQGHEGHIPRALLAMMEAEGVVEQDAVSKAWRLRSAEPVLNPATAKSPATEEP